MGTQFTCLCARAQVPLPVTFVLGHAAAAGIAVAASASTPAAAKRTTALLGKDARSGKISRLSLAAWWPYHLGLQTKLFIQVRPRGGPSAGRVEAPVPKAARGRMGPICKRPRGPSWFGPPGSKRLESRRPNPCARACRRAAAACAARSESTNSRSAAPPAVAQEQGSQGGAALEQGDAAAVSTRRRGCARRPRAARSGRARGGGGRARAARG